MNQTLRDWFRTHEKPAIRIVDGEPSSLSWFGGNPSVPNGFQWPTFRRQSLPFLGQIHLAGLPVIDGIPSLPRTGTLYFFFAIEGGVSSEIRSERSKSRIIHAALHGISPAGTDEETLEKGFAVIYFEDDMGLVEVAQPGAPPPPESPKGWRKLLGMKAKRGERQSYDRRPIAFEKAITVSDDVPEDLIESDDELEVEELLYGRSDRGIEHQLFGYPRPVQSTADEMAKEISQPPLGPDDGDWILLLQVDEVNKTGFMWIDCGTVYFWISEQDLSSARFDRVRAIIDFS